MGIVKEAGRLPLKRGPKALQEKGVPFYELTKEGLLVALSLNGVVEREEILKKFLTKISKDENEFTEILEKLTKIVPRFTYYLFEKYIKAFCEGKLKKMLPFTIDNLKMASDESIIIQREFLEAFSNLSKSEKDTIMNFLRKIS